MAKFLVAGKRKIQDSSVWHKLKRGKATFNIGLENKQKLYSADQSNSEDAQTVDSEQQYTCKFCNEKFGFKYKMAIHIKEFHSSETSIIEKNADENHAAPPNEEKFHDAAKLNSGSIKTLNSEQKLICNFCDEEFNVQSEMAIHINECHLDLPPGIFEQKGSNNDAFGQKQPFFNPDQINMDEDMNTIEQKYFCN